MIKLIGISTSTSDSYFVIQLNLIYISLCQVNACVERMLCVCVCVCEENHQNMKLITWQHVSLIERHDHCLTPVLYYRYHPAFPVHWAIVGGEIESCTPPAHR